MAYHSTPLPSPLGRTLTTNLIQVHTDERGSIDYDRSVGTAVLNYPQPAVTSVLDRRGAAFSERFHDLAETRHGRIGSLPIYARSAGFGSDSTYHGLGGVVVDRAADRTGAVHGYDNLYVVDGSFAPGAVGLVSPSLTIAAIAERLMDGFIATH